MPTNNARMPDIQRVLLNHAIIELLHALFDQMCHSSLKRHLPDRRFPVGNCMIQIRPMFSYSHRYIYVVY